MCKHHHAALITAEAESHMNHVSHKPSAENPDLWVEFKVYSKGSVGVRAWRTLCVVCGKDH